MDGLTGRAELRRASAPPESAWMAESAPVTPVPWTTAPVPARRADAALGPPAARCRGSRRRAARRPWPRRCPRAARWTSACTASAVAEPRWLRHRRVTARPSGQAAARFTDAAGRLAERLRRGGPREGIRLFVGEGAQEGDGPTHPRTAWSASAICGPTAADYVAMDLDGMGDLVDPADRGRPTRRGLGHLRRGRCARRSGDRSGRPVHRPGGGAPRPKSGPGRRTRPRRRPAARPSTIDSSRVGSRLDTSSPK